MLNRVLFLLLLCYAPFTGANAQVDSVTVEKVSIINAKHKVEGIYRTFDEFRRNQPFHTDTFTVIPAGDAMGGGTNLKYLFKNKYVDHVEYNGRTKPISNGSFGQRYFGYCRDDKLYIGFWRFHRIDDFGHLSLIRVVEYRHRQGSPGIASGFGGGGMASSSVGGGMEYLFKKWFVLDYMTGELYAINAYSLLEKFEKWDKELYSEYRKLKKDKFKIEVQLEFVRKFNQRNPIRF